MSWLKIAMYANSKANMLHRVFLPPQRVSEPVLPLSPLMSASLLSEHVERERDEGGQERFRVRMLFHKRGDTSTRGTCITLHAFKETEEHKGSCITQVKTSFSLNLVFSLCLSYSFAFPFPFNLSIHLSVLFSSLL